MWICSKGIAYICPPKYGLKEKREIDCNIKMNNKYICTISETNRYLTRHTRVGH